MSDKHKDERFNESLVRCHDKVLSACCAPISALRVRRSSPRRF